MQNEAKQGRPGDAVGVQRGVVGNGADKALETDPRQSTAPPRKWIVQQVPGVDLPPMKVKEHERREAPNSLTRPPFMAGFFGSRGSGKTTCMLNLVRMYDRMHAFDKIVFFTPTFSKDPKFEAFQEEKPNAEVEFVENYSDERMSYLIREMEKKLEEYEKHKKAREAFGKFKKGTNVDEMPDEDLLALYAYDFMNPDATERFKHGRPSTLIVFDDMVGDKRVYRGDSAGIVGRFALRHRHFNCSLCFLSQAYKSGIPRQLRNNLSLAVFFANKSDRIKEEISEEMSSFISPEDFIQLWNYSTDEPHGFFMVDFDAKDPKHRFRKGFDKVIFSAEIVEQQKRAKESEEAKKHNVRREKRPPPSEKEKIAENRKKARGILAPDPSKKIPGL